MVSFLPPQRWSWTSLLPSCCLLIINEDKDNISEQGLTMLQHSCGWLSAQIQSCRSFWHCQSPQVLTGRSTVLTCQLVSAQWHGRCEPGIGKVIIYWSENVENGKRQHNAASSSGESFSDMRAKCKQDLIQGGLLCTIQHSRPRWRIETSNIPERACNITECSDLLSVQSKWEKGGGLFMCTPRLEPHPFPKHINSRRSSLFG